MTASPDTSHRGRQLPAPVAALKKLLFGAGLDPGHDAGAAARDLHHRPRHADRPGAGRRRRTRLEGAPMTRSTTQLGLDKPLIVQFFYYLRRRGARQFRPLAADRAPGDPRTSRASFPRRWSWRRWARIIGIVIGVPLGVLAAVAPRQLDRPDRPRRGAGRLFDADLLAGSRRPAGLLRHPRLGRRTGPGQRLLRRHGADA